VALIPLAGLIFGPAALVLALLGRLRERETPSARGAAQVKAALFLGTLTMLTNWTGVLLMLHGLGWGL
jgi:hypothetical protein